MGPILNEAATQKLKTSLSEGEFVRSGLDGDGRLHIDRPLPFLVTWVRPEQAPDASMRRLVESYASYLEITKYAEETRELIDLIGRSAAERFGSFLRIDLWEAPPAPHSAAQPHVLEPTFYLSANAPEALAPVLERLETDLNDLTIHGRHGRTLVGTPVEIAREFGADAAPPVAPDLHAIPPTTDDDATGASDQHAQAGEIPARPTPLMPVIRIGIAPIYRSSVTGRPFPQVLQELQRKLTPILRQAIFEFAKAETTLTLHHPHQLGRRVMVKAAREIDERLAEVERSFDFLLLSTPVNVRRAWEEFRKRRHRKLPLFWYRPVPFDPEVIKRGLYDLPIEKVEDPTLASLFREKQEEIDRKVTMLRDRGTIQYLYGSLQVYGGVDHSLYKLALELLDRIEPESEEERGPHIDGETMLSRARAEFAAYPTVALKPEVHLRPDLTNLMVSKSALLIPQRLSLPERRVDALLQHEVGVHLVTWFNGGIQPLGQLQHGLAGYEDFQEGLAVTMEYLAGGLDRARLRLLAARVLAVRCLLQGATFVDTFERLVDEYAFEPYEAFHLTTRVWRGGGLTKDAIYLRGLVQVLNLLAQGQDIEPLFVGKIAASHVPVMEELRLRGMLKPQPLVPRVLERPSAQRRLERLRRGLRPADLCAPEPGDEDSEVEAEGETACV